MSYSLGLPYRVDGYLWTAKWVSTDAIQVFMIRTKTTVCVPSIMTIGFCPD